MDLIDKYLTTLIELCKTQNVDKLYLFGSALSDKFNDECNRLPQNIAPSCRVARVFCKKSSAGFLTSSYI